MSFKLKIASLIAIALAFFLGFVKFMETYGYTAVISDWKTAMLWANVTFLLIYLLSGGTVEHTKIILFSILGFVTTNVTKLDGYHNHILLILILVCLAILLLLSRGSIED